ncbi:hypothetical protein H9Q69_014048 [Fusarium xylarioides]|nr:hypothetical protein H9Q69_014048 [Fusarium xylarioides]
MAASIAAECHGVPRCAVAEISIARFTNNGPQSFKKLLPGTTFKAWLRVLMVVLLLLTMASQFTSTLLVTDLQESRISSFSKTMSYGFTLEQVQDPELKYLPVLGLANNYWDKKPVLSEMFAEYSHPGRFGKDFDDTGTTLRAFLPITVQAERENLRSFKGMARVIDTRVACVRPEIRARFCFDLESNAYFICANVTADLSNIPHYVGDDMWKHDEDQYSFPFICPIFQDGINLPTLKDWLLCKAADPKDRYTPLPPGPADYDSGALGTNATWEHINSTTSGPWLRQWSRVTWDDGREKQDFHHQLSLCFTYENSAAVEHLNITASTSTNHTEPLLRYNSETDRYDTWAVRNQLGAVGKNEKDNSIERQILRISEEDIPQSLKENFLKARRRPYGEEGNPDWLMGITELGTKDLAICPLCDLGFQQYQTTNLVVSQLFNDVLNMTDSPTLALQALNTLIFRMAYYDQISSFVTAADQATITRFELIQAPKYKWGLVAVMAIVSGNVVIFAIVVVVFLSATNSSFIDNIWHTIAQISQSRETRPLLEKAILATDKDIDNWLHRREPPKGLVGNVKEFFRDIRCLLDQRKLQDQEKLLLQNGVLKKP